MSKLLTPQDVRNRIANGEAIVIYEGLVLKLDKWIDYHPGGDKAIFHMVGRDATDEMNSYHTEATQETFKRFRVGKIKGKWHNMLPPIQGGVYKKQNLKKNASDPSIGSSGSGFDSSSTIDVEAKCSDDENHIPNDSKNNGHNNNDNNNGDDGDDCDGKSLNLSDETLAEKKPKVRLAGEPDGKVVPQVPQEAVFTIDKSAAYLQKIIRDPEAIVDQYDNQHIEDDLKAIPPLDYDTQMWLSGEYNQLHRQIIDAGLYQCNYWAYFKEGCRIVSMLLWTAIFFKTDYIFLSAVCLGLAWHQMTFVVHDAAHISITHNYQLDSWIGMTVASWIGGLSSTWWKRNHNVHHLVTNDPVHDPDIQHLPFFAVSTRLFKNVYSTYYEKYLYFDSFAQVLIRAQNYLYYPILAFGRFNLYRLSWSHLLLGQGPKKGKAAWFRYYEIVGLTFFAYWFGYVLVYQMIPTAGKRWLFVLASHVASMPVHVQIVLSHFAMSTSDLGVSESFPSKQLRTTMDVDCPEWFDYIHGGLQFQAIHHLFPRLPRHNFRKAQPYVINFCKKVGLQYTIYGFGKGNKKVLTRLGEIAHQAKILAECTKSMKKEAMGEKNI